MSLEQINELIEVEVLSEGSAPTSPTNKSEIKDDRVAADILSAPEPAVSPTLKTRKQLIAKIREVCAHRGIDPKPMNLGRRRKNSLQDIIQTQFAEAAETVVGDEEIPEGFEGAPKNMAYAVQMLYRMDLTLCRLLEGSVDWTSGYHGMTASGFTQGIETNDRLSDEIKSCWQELLEDPENEWIAEYCTAGSRLVLAHVYGLMSVLRSKNSAVQHAPPEMPQARVVPERRQTRGHVVPEISTSKFLNLVRKRQASRQNQPDPVAVPAGARGVVLEV